MNKGTADFVALNVAILTVSDKHTAESDTSGNWLAQAAGETGHRVVDHLIVADNRYAVRAAVSVWIARDDVQVVLVNGGTGFNRKNSTPEALLPLFDREIEGFGELFRMMSFEDVGTSSIQSRAVGGLANATLILAVPGSTSACQLAWQRIIEPQLDARTRPCNFVSHVKKR